MPGPPGCRGAIPPGPWRSRVRSRGSGLLLAACAALVGAAWRWVGGATCWSAQPASGRRGALAAAAAAAAIGAGPDRADAFANAVKKIKRDLNYAKRPGPQPGDLGLSKGRPGYEESDEPALKECGTDPHCFSTTWQFLDVGKNNLEPWQYSGKNLQAAMKDVVDVVQSYTPGQSGIDGGGFEVKASGDDFIYVQYESLKKGYLDDVEFQIKPGTSPDATAGSLLVRSSSRQGFFDYGVNAIRLNRLADDLKQKGGWAVKKIDHTTHSRYFEQNCKTPFLHDNFPDLCGPYK